LTKVKRPDSRVVSSAGKVTFVEIVRDVSVAGKGV